MHIKGAFLYAQIPGITEGNYRMSIPYPKTWLSVPDQLQKLQGRGLVIADLAVAADALRHINYYCFTGYGLAFEQSRHHFIALSKMLQGLAKSDQKRVAARYGFQPLTLASCVHHLVYVRNLCAHHSRLWDRIWAIKPDLPAGKLWSPPHVPDNTQLFSSLLIQSTMLRCIAAEQDFARDWHQRMQSLITAQLPTCPDPLKKMGLPQDWAKHPFWA